MNSQKFANFSLNSKSQNDSTLKDKLRFFAKKITVTY